MQLECWDSAGCNADSVLRALRNPTRLASAGVFCSEYLQSTSTVCTTITVTSGATETETSAITTTTTALTTDASTTTVTCAAAPTLLPTCGFEADGFPIYMISLTVHEPDRVPREIPRRPYLQRFPGPSGREQLLHSLRRPNGMECSVCAKLPVFICA
jgi:hypothetical protein